MSVLFSFLAAPAHAWVFVGNPNPEFKVDRPGHDIVSAVATVDAVRMYACAGGYTDIPVNATLDLADGFDVVGSPGNWCGAGLVLGSTLVVTNGSWTVEYDQTVTALPVDEDPEWVSTALTPYDVVSGTFSGYAPRLVLSVTQ